MSSSNPLTSSGQALPDNINLDAFVPKLLANISDQNERGTIESILAFGDKLLLGLSTGTLHVYSVDDVYGTNPKATLSKVYKAFSLRPIEKLGLLKDAGCLVVLAEGIVSVFDLESYTLDEKLVKTKGATTFSITSGVRHIDEDSIPVMISRLLVACKTRLVCYEWRDAEFTEYKELHLPDRIKTITFLNPDKAVCGLASDYCIVDIPSSSVSNIVLPGSHDSSFKSLGMSYIGIGGRQPTPHSVRLPNDTALLVKDLNFQFIDSSGQLLDKPVIPWDIAPEGFGFSYPYLICIFPKHIEIRNPDTFTLLQTLKISGVHCVNDGKLAYVSNSTQIYRLLSSDFALQVNTLAESQLSEAISLLTLIDPAFIEHKEALLRELQIKKAIQMFKKKDYRHAMLLFSNISAPPETVINLFPLQISGTAKDLIELTDHLNNDESAMNSQPKTSPNLSPSKILRHAGTEIPPVKANESIEASNTDDSSSESASPPPSHSPLLNWSEKDLAIATRSLLNFLADTRRKISSLLISEEPILFQGVELSKEIYGDLEKAAELVDTTLFKCYIIQNSSLVGPLLRIQNHCDSDTVKTILSKASKWRELIDFYFAKQLHHEALHLLHTLGTSNQVTPSYLEGPEPTVRYLQRLNNDYIDLIFEFATWPISENESFGADLFLEDSTESESLNRHKVLEYLKVTSSSLAIQYLEYIINEKEDSSSHFHTALAVAYVKSLANPANSNPNDIFLKLFKFLKTSPSHYRIERVLSSLPKHITSPLLLEVKAILCGRRGQHREALEIYTYQIRDSLKARTYCSELYENDKEAGRAALHILMSLYLTPQKDQMQRLDLALELLSSQGSRMSVVDIINTLPNSTSIRDLAIFLTSQIRTLKKSWNTVEMDTSLRKVNLIKTQETLLAQQQRSVTITNLKTCRVCFKRLGHSVISVFPNGTAIHYGCARIYQTMLDEEATRMNDEKTKALKSSNSTNRSSLKPKSSLTNMT